MAAREDFELVQVADDFAGQRVYLGDSLYFVTKKFHTVSDFFAGREDVYYIATHPEGPAMKIDVVALVLNICQMPQKLVANAALAALDLDS